MFYKYHGKVSRVVEYLNNGKRTKNPDYDSDRIFELDLPGYLKS